MAEQEAVVVAPETVVAPQIPAPEGVEKPAEIPQPPVKTYSQDEVDRITAKVKKNAAYRAKKEAEAYYKGLQHGTQVTAPKAAEEAPKAPTEPKREQFADYESYLEARTDWIAEQKVEKRLAKEREESSRRSATTEQEKAVQKFKEQADAIAKEIEDFQEVMETSDAPLTNAMRDAIYETDIPARVAYHLAKNPDEARRIAALSSARQAVEIGKLEAKLTEAKPEPTPPNAEPAPPKPAKEASKAPEPIKPVGGRATLGNDEPDAKTHPEEWFKWRNRQVLARTAAARKAS